ncbi:MAG: amidohydrolase family protein [Candidatus Bathyarchaeota archaeon]|nr:amidohydrolase family protein [Candidatus Bathyarchaeota archaeon]
MDSKVGIPVIDAHSHYFNADTLRNWLSRGRTMESFAKRTSSRTDMTSIELPDENFDTAQRWVDELDKYGIETMGVMVGVEAYDEFLETMKRFPDRFIGYANINPAEPDATDKVKKAHKDGFKGIKLYPSSWKGMKAYDEIVYPVYEACKEKDMLVFLHFGITIGGQADLRNGNPIDIQVPSRDFPGLKFIIAHFGAGWFREVLMMQYQADNVYMDSSGSNSWMKYLPYDIDLKQVFKKALTTGGSHKVLFGTDSTFFPRGWRINVLEAQYRACKELEADGVITSEDIHNVFYGNIQRMTGYKPPV